MASSSSINKKRKIDTECRIFKSSWTENYFVAEHKGNVICVICQETIAVMKEYNIKRHYTSKHAAKYDELCGQIRSERVKLLKHNCFGQQSMFKTFHQTNEDATRISFLIAEEIAKRGKPFLDGEFVKDCLDIFCSVACPDKKTVLDNVSLSHQTIGRRVAVLAENIETKLTTRLSQCEKYSLALDESTDINDTAQLAIFIRGITTKFDVVEELLDLRSMKGQTTGQDIFEEVTAVLQKFNLPIDKLCGVTTDGAPSMTGNVKGFVALLLNSVSQPVSVHHCIIHQEHLCAKTLDLKNVMEKVVSTVNFIRSRGLNHRQFRAFLVEIGADHDNVLYFTSVRWLSRATCLNRFWSLRHEIAAFMTSKGKNVSFLTDDLWLNDCAFLVDITKHLSDLNVKLQGENQTVNKLYEHVVAFIQTLQLFKTQLDVNKCVHFATLSSRLPETVDYTRYSSLISRLKNEFETRFNDFKVGLDSIKLCSDPFSVDANNVSDQYQLELIQLQNNAEIKRAFAGHDLITFYKDYVSSEDFPALHKLAVHVCSLFGSTYCCEQLFSRLKGVKTSSRSLLSDRHLQGVLRIATASVRADVSELCKKKQCQISH